MAFNLPPVFASNSFCPTPFSQFKKIAAMFGAWRRDFGEIEALVDWMEAFVKSDFKKNVRK